MMAIILPEQVGKDLCNATGGSVRRGVVSLLQCDGVGSGADFDAAGNSCQLDCDAVPETSSGPVESEWYFRNLFTMHLASSEVSPSTKSGGSCFGIGPVLQCKTLTWDRGANAAKLRPESH